MLFDLMQEAGKHGLHIEAAVVSEAVFVKVRLQVFLADRMIDASNAAFDETPEAFNGIRVDVANDVHLGAMFDAMMRVPIFGVSDPIIGSEFICKHRTLWQNVFVNHVKKSAALQIIHSDCADTAFTLDDTHNGSFLFVSAHRSASSMFARAAVIHFIHLNAWTALASQWACILFVQHRTNLPKHSPRGFVSHSRFSLNLFRANPTACRGHQVDCIKPRSKGSRRFMKDRVGGRMKVIAAVIARVRRAANNAVMLRFFPALVAERHTVRSHAEKQPFKANSIIRELFSEVVDGVRLHLRLAVVVRHVALPTEKVALKIPTVKG